MTYSLDLTVALCTHQPHRGRLDRTLEGLKKQTLPADQWELTLIDNASPEPLADAVDLSWHPAGRVVREERLGLTNARLKAIEVVEAEAMVWVDDDNVLDPAYLANALARFEGHADVGLLGGRCVPEYEQPPPDWFEDHRGPLGLHDSGGESLITDGEPGYPPFAPCGAGMCTRTAVMKHWAGVVRDDPVRRALGRSGASLASGEDNDIVLSALAAGWRVGYFPELSLTHLIPSGRLTEAYHRRILRASNRSWVTVLSLYDLSPWPPSHPAAVPLRKARAALRIRPWGGTVNRLKYAAACGQLEGRADVWRVNRGKESASDADEGGDP